MQVANDGRMHCSLTLGYSVGVAKDKKVQNECDTNKHSDKRATEPGKKERRTSYLRECLTVAAGIGHMPLTLQRLERSDGSRPLGLAGAFSGMKEGSRIRPRSAQKYSTEGQTASLRICLVRTCEATTAPAHFMLRSPGAHKQDELMLSNDN